jgi:hypothetical protein
MGRGDDEKRRKKKAAVLYLFLLLHIVRLLGALFCITYQKYTRKCIRRKKEKKI